MGLRLISEVDAVRGEVLLEVQLDMTYEGRRARGR